MIDNKKNNQERRLQFQKDKRTTVNYSLNYLYNITLEYCDIDYQILWKKIKFWSGRRDSNTSLVCDFLSHTMILSKSILKYQNLPF